MLRNITKRKKAISKNIQLVKKLKWIRNYMQENNQADIIYRGIYCVYVALEKDD